MEIEISPLQVVMLLQLMPPTVQTHAAMNRIQIKTRLWEKELSIAEVARRVGISRTMVSLILKGERKGYRHRARIARILGFPIGELFNGGSNGPRN